MNILLHKKRRELDNFDHIVRRDGLRKTPESGRCVVLNVCVQHVLEDELENLRGHFRHVLKLIGGFIVELKDRFDEDVLLRHLECQLEDLLDYGVALFVEAVSVLVVGVHNRLERVEVRFCHQNEGLVDLNLFLLGIYC